MKSAVLALALYSVALAAQATQVASQHQHGSGTLGIAFSGAEFTLSLAVPGVDIVGFEHPAANDDDRALVAVAVSDLSKPLELFLTPVEAGCFAASANVTLNVVTPGQEGEAESGQVDPEAPAHSEFQADYVIQCQDMNALDRIEFAFFDRFEGAEKLDVSVEASGDVQSFDVTPAKRLVDMSDFR